MILTRLRNTYDEWPIGLAMADLETYEQAGTLTSALTATAESAATAKIANEAAADGQIRSVAFDASIVSVTLQDYLGTPDDALAKQRDAKLRAAMTAAGVPTTTTTADFVVLDTPLKRETLLQLIAIEKDDKDALKTLQAAFSGQ
ncbi:MAG: hypothetical protein ACKVOP_05660 [Sphingomonadaceae bacterium]